MPMERALLQDGGDSDASEGPDASNRMSEGCCMRCCRQFTVLVRRIPQHNNFKLVLAVLLGQVLSGLLCGTGVTSQLIEEKYNIAVPATQAFINYAILACVFGSALALQRGFLGVLWKNWWKYAILGVVDVEANYLVILAYRYTNLTSVQLLDSFTIASVMVLSFLFLRARYKLINLMGVCLSIIGIICLVLADIRGERVKHGTDPIRGDLLCLAGSVLYAVSNVAQEFLVKNHTIKEYLGLLGVSGSVVSAIQLIVLERKTLARIDWTNPEIAPLFIGFGVFQFLFYALMPVVIILSSAVLVNLSLLSADFYTFFFGLFLFKYKFSFFYVLAFILIILGVFIYNLRQPSTAKRREDTERERGRGRERSSEERTRSIRTRLRGFFLESKTFELSESRKNWFSRSRITRKPRSRSEEGVARYGTVGGGEGGVSRREKRPSQSENDALLLGNSNQ